MKKITMKDSISTMKIKDLEVGQEIDNGVFKVVRENNPDFEYYYNVSVYRANGELTHLKFCSDRFEAGNVMDTFILGVFFAGYGIYEYDKEKTIMEIKLKLTRTCSDDGKHSYSDIKDAYRDGIKYVEKCNKEGYFANAGVRIYIDEHLEGEIFISSKFSGKRNKKGYYIPCEEGYDVLFADYWASSEEIRIKVNKLFDEVR